MVALWLLSALYLDRRGYRGLNLLCSSIAAGVEQDALEGGRQGGQDIRACQAHQQLEPRERSQAGVRDAGDLNALSWEDTLPPRAAPALLK